jgi:glycosyltransferase involved in cell wall biosynthesis
MRRTLNIDPETLVLGHVGRLAPEKNLTFLGQAVARAMEDIPGSVFVLTGDGPSLEVVRQEFASRGLADRLIITGKKTGQELSDIYQAMDLFVFASTSETQGMVLTEAMAAGNPVIALDASGTREVVVDKVNGRLLPAQASTEDFVRAIIQWATGQVDRQAWSDAARETARSFSRQRCARSLADVYVSALSSFHPEVSPLEDLQPWVSVMTSLKTEWDLISQKTSAFVSAVTPPQAK